MLAIVGVLKVAEARGLEPLKSAMSSRQQSASLSAAFLSPAMGVDQDFFRFLAANTNLPHSLIVKPVNVDFITAPAPDASNRPNIFIITVDSLRRDYLSPYNDRVTFTPAIEEFAKENLVYQKAFTRYGGTGLSEPSIWAGSLLLHKQYVTPFAPMNTLEKLIRTAGYRTFVSRDTILTTLLSPARPGIDVDLDSTVQNMDYDLGHSLRELQTKLEASRDDRDPVFAYTQPQNLHISVLQRQGSSVPAGEHYPGFHAPYASRVRAVDTAFGAFIEYLKRSGLYERSLVILTSDHGDSLGEDGRWGHAYTIYPEIVRIPLLVHLPSETHRDWATDTNGVVFSADITPTLHALLGYQVSSDRPEYGAAFLQKRNAGVSRNREGLQFVASSYGAVYGALTPDGSRLFIADAVNYSEYCYDLTGSKPVATAAPAEFAEQARAFIHSRVESLARMYNIEGRL